MIRVDPSDVHKYMDIVIDGLKNVLARNPDTWTIDDAVTLLNNGTLDLHYDDIGFLVLYHQKNWHSTDLVVFAAYSKHPNFSDDFLEYLKEEGRRLGVEKLIFCTKRKGWDRKCHKKGWQLQTKVFEMRV